MSTRTTRTTRTTYSFDVTLLATIRVPAANVAEARRLLRATIAGTSANLGAWPSGDPIVVTVDLEGEGELQDEDEDDFAEHQAADPHCTCNDCLADHATRTGDVTGGAK